MKLESAEFVFVNHKVVFIGGLICFYENAGGRWEMIGERENAWTNRRSKENNGVMGRSYKPRVTDAESLLKIQLRKQTAKT